MNPYRHPLKHLQRRFGIFLDPQKHTIQANTVSSPQFRDSPPDVYGGTPWVLEGGWLQKVTPAPRGSKT